MGSNKGSKDLMLLQRSRKEAKPSTEIMARPGFASNGRAISLLTNHFPASVRIRPNDYFCHYSVSLQHEDGSPAEPSLFGRQAINMVKQIYGAEFITKDFAYDGEHSLFTIGPLPQVRNEFIVVIERISSSSIIADEAACSLNGSETKRLRRPTLTKTLKININYAAKVPMRALLANSHQKSQEALRVLDTILRQQSANRGCLIVQQNYFYDTPRSYIDISGGMLGCRGFHSSFHKIQNGLSLNMDTTTAVIVKPGPVLDFILNNQNIKDPFQIDWDKARRTMRTLKIKTIISKLEYKITGFSELPCNQEMFTLTRNDENGSLEVDITVYDYYLKYKRIELQKSANLPCVDVGKPNRPVYLPIEICRLLSMQRYKKNLTTFQRVSLAEKTRQKPQERMRYLEHAIEINNYNAEPLLIASGVHLSNQFTEVKGRVLEPPRLKMGNGVQFKPEKGQWSIHSKIVDEPLLVIGEERSSTTLRGADRVENMFKRLKDKLPGIQPKFILCILPDRRINNDIYGPWKRACLSKYGIVSQCIAPKGVRISDHYFNNVLMKINVKLCGQNSTISTSGLPYVYKTPTIIIGMDVAHGRSGESNVPSVAAVASSMWWPSISKYRASTRTQSPRHELIDSLFKLGADKRDDGFIRTALIEFYKSCGRKPDHIIVFRDRVGDTQFNQIMNMEFSQILKACEFLEEGYSPKFTIIVSKKKHHTRFFMSKSIDNVPPGTVVDKGICHPRNFDFYITPHAGAVGTSRPVHYCILHDEIGLSPDDLQELVHWLSYIYQKSTTAISIVAPIAYARLAALQMSRVLNSHEASGATSSQHKGVSEFPVMPVLHEKVSNSMYFC